MGVNDSMSLFQVYDDLAKACQKRFGVTEKLTLADMVKLITPPAFPSGTEILGRTTFRRIDNQDQDIPLTLEVVPPVMNKPIKLLITVSSDDFLYVSSNTKLIFNKSDGTQLVLAIPQIITDYKDGEHWVKTVSVTIPANTSIANNKAILRVGEHSYFSIKKIIATY